ncbi:hypothetical protein QMO56_26490 [Roseomonas sp. E05]|uniref:hypothetical protein n=1 Tax=Roseomonas sp. E05 TaxID=3046310 RepID=UPI0024BAA0D5|nr:hypothetical protein [Roseomonas sp. E05]MDJ0391647.1 hypothetical protein [Roseomonas sp. E05]
MLGCVRAWSAAAEGNVRAYREQRTTEPVRTGSAQGPAGIRSGRDLMSVRDF